MLIAYHNFILIGILFLLISFLFLSNKRKLIKNAGLKKAVNVFAIIVIALTGLWVAVFPDFGSVKTTGDYPYACRVVELTDESRIESFISDGSPRKLSVLVYYPDADCIENNTCPLVVFSHGGISTKTSNLSLYKELASHGYVVASIDHTYHAICTEIDGEKIFVDFGFIKEFLGENSYSDIENSYACFQKWMKLRTDDINFVLDTFIRKSSDDGSSFYSLINANSIGVAGHSLGGAAALGVARLRDDIKAVIALESPYMCDIIGVNGVDFVWNTSPYPCPVMNIYSDTGYPLIETDNKYAQNKNLLYSENAENYHITGSNHFTLTDLVRTSPALCALLGGGYERPGYDTLEFINQKSVAFLDKYLK